MNIFRSLIIGLGFICSLCAEAAVSAADIHAFVSDYSAGYTGELQQQYGPDSRISYRVTRLDSRLTLADCPIPFAAQIKNGSNHRHLSIKVSCEQGNPWSIYVPVKVEIYRPIVVASSPVARGTPLRADHLQLQEIDIARLRGSYYTDPDQLIGMEAKRVLNSNQVILSTHLNPPLMIKKGDAVLVSASTTTLTVKMPGIAQQDGRQGQQIRVKNKQSQRTVHARVVAPGQVQVVM